MEVSCERSAAPNDIFHISRPRDKSWDGALAAVGEAVAGQLTLTVLVIDELPWLVQHHASTEVYCRRDRTAASGVPLSSSP